MPTTPTEPLEPSFSLAERLAGLTSVSACYQCKKCSAGCPLTFAMDLCPDQVIRLALLGQENGCSIPGPSGSAPAAKPAPVAVPTASTSPASWTGSKRKRSEAGGPYPMPWWRLPPYFSREPPARGGRLSETKLLRALPCSKPAAPPFCRTQGRPEFADLGWPGNCLEQRRRVSRWPAGWRKTSLADKGEIAEIFRKG